MSETPILNAPVYPHGYVTGRYLTAVADGPDDDHLMDFTPAKGKVIFTPETVIRRHEGPSPALVVQRPVECPINSQGYLTSPDGWRGVSLIVGIYSVRFEVQGAQVPGPKRIQVKASHTQDAPLDLVLSMPEVVPPGSVVVVDETTAQRAEAAAARAEAVVTNLESEVRAVVLASPELKGERGEPGEQGEPGAPGAVPTSSDYLIVGPGRPDQPATTGGVIKGSEPVGSEYRSTDGAGAGLFDWMKRPTGWVNTGGGSGVEQVSGTVTLDASGAPIREFFTTGATTFKANGADTLLSSFTAVVWRRNSQGSWGYQVVQDSWTTPTPTPDTTAPVAGTLAVTVTDVKADLTVSGASDDRGYVQFSFSKDNGATWTAYQDSSAYTFTGLTASTAYTFKHRVKDTAGNVATGTAVSKTTAAAPARVADWAGLEAVIKADAPSLYFPLDDPAGTTSVVSEGTWSGAGTTTATPANVVFNGEYADFNGTNAIIPGNSSSGLRLHTGTAGFTSGTMEAVIRADTTKRAAIFGSYNAWHLGVDMAQADGGMGSSGLAVGAITAGQTYHLMHTFNGTTSKLYINGVLAGSVADTRTISAQGYAFFPMGDGAVGWYDGTIRHAAVYMGKALTEADALKRAQKAGLA